MTYPKALLLALCSGVGTYLGIAAAQHATVTSAIPYGIGGAVFVGLFACMAVAYKNGQPPRK